MSYYLSNKASNTGEAYANNGYGKKTQGRPYQLEKKERFSEAKTSHLASHAENQIKFQ